jgi:membrane protein
MADIQPSIPTLAKEAVQRLFADEAIPLAGNIAFRTIFSVFPFLIFMTTLAGFVGNEALAQRVVTYLLSVAPEQIVAPLVPEIRSILTVQRKGLAGFAALLTVWSAMGGIDCLRVALNRAYDLREHRGLWRLYGLDILFVIGSAVGLMLFSALIIVAPLAIAIIDAHAPGFRQSLGVLDALRVPVAMALLTTGLFMCHRVLPARRIPFRAILPGVLFTVLVWFLLATVFSAYLVSFNTFAKTYASLSGVFAAMFFLYLSALALIFGGELNRVLMIHRESRDSAPEPVELGDQ